MRNLGFVEEDSDSHNLTHNPSAVMFHIGGLKMLGLYCRGGAGGKHVSVTYELEVITSNSIKVHQKYEVLW